VNCLFAQFCKVRVPAYWNRTNPMRSESIGDPSLHLHPSSVCLAIDSSSQFSTRVSDQYAYSHACSKNTVRLHASSLPAPSQTPLVKGLEEATYTSDHDTCIRPYDTIRATTPFPSLVCCSLNLPRLETLLTSLHRLSNNMIVGGESSRMLANAETIFRPLSCLWARMHVLCWKRYSRAYPGSHAALSDKRQSRHARVAASQWLG